MINGTPKPQTILSRISNCGTIFLPLKYLGIPISHKVLKSSDWSEIVNKFNSNIEGWGGHWLCLVGHL